MKIEYTQDYIASADMTIIFKTIYDGYKEVVSIEVSGFYFGEPSIKGLDTFKESGAKYERD